MPTNDERREVAARLRELYPDDVLPPSSQVRIDICYTIGCGFGQEHQGEKIHNRLADLIEPEPERTCRITEDSRFACVIGGAIYTTHFSCGHFMENSIIKNEINFCPTCGAKVVE